MKSKLVCIISIICILCCACISTAMCEESFREIPIEPSYIALNDDNLMIEITSVSETISNIGTDFEFTEYRVNYTVTSNNKEYNISTNLGTTDGGVGRYTVEFMNGNAHTLPYKINDTAYYSVVIYTKPEMGFVSNGAEHITALEDLLDFNANIEICLYEDQGSIHAVKQRYNVKVDLGDYLASISNQ